MHPLLELHFDDFTDLDLHVDAVLDLELHLDLDPVFELHLDLDPVFEQHLDLDPVLVLDRDPVLVPLVDLDTVLDLDLDLVIVVVSDPSTHLISRLVLDGNVLKSADFEYDFVRLERRRFGLLERRWLPLLPLERRRLETEDVRRDECRRE